VEHPLPLYSAVRQISAMNDRVNSKPHKKQPSAYADGSTNHLFARLLL
jgi:hypothetical protein